MDLSKDFLRYGRGAFVQQTPQSNSHAFKDFSGGHVAVGTNETTPQNSSNDAPNVDVDDQGRLVRMPGTTLVEDFGLDSRTPLRMAVHASLDFTAEVLLFDPPWLGVRGPTSTVWTNLALHTGALAFTNFGSTMLFTDGREVYSRQPNSGTSIAIIDEAPVARTYASWANRVWAGMAVIDGNYEPHGLIWSAANSDYRDWTGTGAGFELLINDLAMGDQVQALIPMGVDYMAIFLRSSVWVATRTGNTDRPGDFRVRQPRTGAVNGRVCQASRAGVIYLNESGVHVFNGNNSVHVSEQIDGEILPLDIDNLQSYFAVFDPRTDKYHLFTPAGQVWILSLKHGRWTRQDRPVDDSAIWYRQVAPITWADLAGDWGAQSGFSWNDFSQTSDTIDLIYLSDITAGGQSLSREDVAVQNVFGSVATPRWTFPSIPGASLNRLVTIDQIVIEYESGGDLEFEVRDENNDLVSLGTFTLPTVTKPTKRTLTDQRLAQAVGGRISWGDTSTVQIHSLEYTFSPSGVKTDMEVS